MTSLRLVLMEGTTLTLSGVVGEDGTCETSTWLGNLPTQAQVQFQARFERLCAVGYLRSPDEMHPLECPGDPRVHEIKVRSGYRLYVVKVRTGWLATHGTKKPKDKHVCREAARCRTALTEYQKRGGHLT